MISKEFLENWILVNNVPLDKLNNGDCENFAVDVIKSCIPDGELVGTDNFCDWWGDGPDSKLPGHCWVMYNGKHYDCDSLQGVENWRDLKIFKNKA